MYSKIRLLAVGLVTLLAATQVCVAATIHVPADELTIQTGIYRAEVGDTVLVAPGTYYVHLDFLGKSIKLIGEAGASSTILVPADSWYTMITFSGSEGPGTELKGFTVTGSEAAYPTVRVGDGASPLITENIFRDNDVDQELIQCHGPAKIHRNLFYNNGGISCVGLYGEQAAAAEIINNTFDGNARGFYSIIDAGIAKNNIVTNSSEHGITGTFAELAYNDVWNNNPDYNKCDPGFNDINANPQYLDASDHDYSLSAMSPCIDAGDPDPQYYDLDKSRNDMGAFPTTCSDPTDSDGDGTGDRCDNCPETYNPPQHDIDEDYIGDACDNCVDVANHWQEDTDHDGMGNACENDDDNDAVLDTEDNCPVTYNPDQSDGDGDGIGDVCDNCIAVSNPDQADADGNGIGDACECSEAVDCVGYCDLDGYRGFAPLDVVILVKYIYHNLDARVVLESCPGDNGDWDCDGLVNPTDLVWYVSRVYKNYPIEPCNPCQCDPYPDNCPPYP